MEQPNPITDSPLSLAEASPAQAAVRPEDRTRPWVSLLWDVLLIAVLLCGAYFRYVGVNWDQNQHLHPDERFLTMVETSIQPVRSLAEYFDTRNSPLNPHNRGFGFYVYGTLPLFAVRYIGEWLGQTGYDQINLVGRQVSALMDLGTVLVVYLIAARLLAKRWPALLAAAFAAFSVLPIQLSHYFTVDTFTNFFGMLALYFATWLLPVGAHWQERKEVKEPARSSPPPSGGLWLADLNRDWASLVPYLLFALALGMAMASKINAFLLAALLPGAVFLRYLSQTEPERERWTGIYLRNLVIAGMVSFLVFRFFQPYAFDSASFLGLFPNEQWIASLRSLASQSTGDVDFPPALQWARRPIWFAFQHMVLWGLGLPLGILAWAGFVWMGYRILRGEWRAFLLIWLWTGLYFAYQSINFTRSMRYQMLVYPTLAIIAAWAVFALWERGRQGQARIPGGRAAAVVVGVSVLALTAAWAFAFTRIYTRPMTRVQASEWIYQNVPGPINLKIETREGITNQPVAFRSGYTLTSDEGPLVLAFRPRQAGQVVEIEFEHLGSPDGDLAAKTLLVALRDEAKGETLASAQLVGEFMRDGDPRGKSYNLGFERPVALDPSQAYSLVLSLSGEQRSLNVSGAVAVTLQTPEGAVRQALPEMVEVLQAGKRYDTVFTAVETGALQEIRLEHVVDWEGRPEEKRLRLEISDPSSGSLLGAAEVQDVFRAENDIRGEPYTFRFASPVALQAGQPYFLSIEQVAGPGALAIYGSKQANESSWDDALPVGLAGYNPYDYNYGIYRSDLNFEMYWDDNQEKLERFLWTLEQADYIFISSNRQWGTTVRVPERYPLTSVYYRSLLGCPAGKEITWCYSVAKPGMFQGELGFELAAVFQSDPNLGSLRFNTQFAEEAFTVYDHPKVLIFRKTPAYDAERVRDILGAVDLSTVIHLTPRQAGSYPGNLLLPASRLAQQRAGGTWAELFDTEALYNRYPVFAVALWYAVTSLLGWVVYPFTRWALRGLPDRGYPLARLVGLLALAYPVWLLGSAGVPFSAGTITAVFAGLLGLNLFLAYRQRRELCAELRERGRYFLRVELLALGFFVLFLLVRLGNPDLWHPAKGGEKPMDFSYFNAVLKSVTFPPYDPWFAGGYINYYYYGFVLIGVPVKWLGIVPSLAYNLILPSLFSLLAMGGFSFGWNLLSATSPHLRTGRGLPRFDGDAQANWPLMAGLASAVGLALLGNWGTVRMVWHGLQRLAEMHVPFEQANILQRIGWTVEGLFRLFTSPGTRLPYGAGDWYWIPSRAIPGEPITEFPAFTFLYADLHAHLIALPVTLLALSWALSVVLAGRAWKGWGQLSASLLLGALAIGALRPTNTWDWPTYLALGCAAVLYTVLRHSRLSGRAGRAPQGVKRAAAALAGVAVLAGLSSLLFQPFTSWYGQAYNHVDPWQGDHTPFWSYLTHWGVFLFVIVSWMTGETVGWMAATPVSALNRLRPYRRALTGGAVGLLVIIVALLLYGVQIAWLVLPLMVWVGILLLRPGLPDGKRVVLFLCGTALALTLFVELAVLRGDVGRMNTVFKFYLQAWTLFALSAGASLIWLLAGRSRGPAPAWRLGWETALAVLLTGAALFPIMGGMDKITDRMNRDAPHTLDGMTYMAYSTYPEGETVMDLRQDYQAIRWLQENVSGSPVIVEANTPQYRWGSRYTIYTGLPGVVGWEWHQIQQRALTPGEWVYQRVAAVNHFYSTGSMAEVKNFLLRYDVKYIIVGQLERALYPLSGLAKFEEQDGSLWQAVYRDGQTVIYEVKQ